MGKMSYVHQSSTSQRFNWNAGVLYGGGGGFNFEIFEALANAAQAYNYGEYSVHVHDQGGDYNPSDSSSSWHNNRLALPPNPRLTLALTLALTLTLKVLEHG